MLAISNQNCVSALPRLWRGAWRYGYLLRH